MRSAAIFALAVAAGVSAQLDANYTSSLDMKIDPNTVVPETRRSDWCRGQFNTCETLCGRDTKDNDCEQSDLSYKCTCSKNGSAPGLQYYTETMPTYICMELRDQCNAKYVGDSRNQKACDDEILSLCATQNPPKNPVTDDEDEDEDEGSSSQTSSSPGPTPAPTENEGDDEDNVTTTSSDGLAAPTLAAAGNGVAAIAAIGVLAYLL